MPSAWGSSWGLSWGASWGETATQDRREVEVVYRPVYIKRGKKIVIFNTVDEADAWVEAQDALDKAKSRGAKKRIAKRVIDQPVDVVDVDLVAGLAQVYNLKVDIRSLIDIGEIQKLRDWRDRILTMRDEEDIEILLMAL